MQDNASETQNPQGQEPAQPSQLNKRSSDSTDSGPTRNSDRVSVQPTLTPGIKYTEIESWLNACLKDQDESRFQTLFDHLARIVLLAAPPIIWTSSIKTKIGAVQTQCGKAFDTANAAFKASQEGVEEKGQHNVNGFVTTWRENLRLLNEIKNLGDPFHFKGLMSSIQNSLPPENPNSNSNIPSGISTKIIKEAAPEAPKSTSITWLMRILGILGLVGISGSIAFQMNVIPLVLTFGTLLPVLPWLVIAAGGTALIVSIISVYLSKRYRASFGPVNVLLGVMSAFAFPAALALFFIPGLNITAVTFCAALAGAFLFSALLLFVVSKRIEGKPFRWAALPLGLSALMCVGSPALFFTAPILIFLGMPSIVIVSAFIAVCTVGLLFTFIASKMIEGKKVSGLSGLLFFLSALLLLSTPVILFFAPTGISLLAMSVPLAATYFCAFLFALAAFKQIDGETIFKKDFGVLGLVGLIFVSSSLVILLSQPIVPMIVISAILSVGYAVSSLVMWRNSQFEEERLKTKVRLSEVPAESANPLVPDPALLAQQKATQAAAEAKQQLDEFERRKEQIPKDFQTEIEKVQALIKKVGEIMHSLGTEKVENANSDPNFEDEDKDEKGSSARELTKLITAATALQKEVNDAKTAFDWSNSAEDKADSAEQNEPDLEKHVQAIEACKSKRLDITAAIQTQLNIILNTREATVDRSIGSLKTKVDLCTEKFSKLSKQYAFLTAILKEIYTKDEYKDILSDLMLNPNLDTELKINLVKLQARFPEQMQEAFDKPLSEAFSIRALEKKIRDTSKEFELLRQELSSPNSGELFEIKANLVNLRQMVSALSDIPLEAKASECLTAQSLLDKLGTCAVDQTVFTAFEEQRKACMDARNQLLLPLDRCTWLAEFLNAVLLEAKFSNSQELREVLSIDLTKEISFKDFETRVGRYIQAIKKPYADDLLLSYSNSIEEFIKLWELGLKLFQPVPETIHIAELITAAQTMFSDTASNLDEKSSSPPTSSTPPAYTADLNKQIEVLRSAQNKFPIEEQRLSLFNQCDVLKGILEAVKTQGEQLTSHQASKEQKDDQFTFQHFITVQKKFISENKDIPAPSALKEANFDDINEKLQLWSVGIELEKDLFSPNRTTASKSDSSKSQLGRQGSSQLSFVKSGSATPLLVPFKKNFSSSRAVPIQTQSSTSLSESPSFLQKFPFSRSAPKELTEEPRYPKLLITLFPSQQLDIEQLKTDIAKIAGNDTTITIQTEDESGQIKLFNISDIQQGKICKLLISILPPAGTDSEKHLENLQALQSSFASLKSGEKPKFLNVEQVAEYQKYRLTIDPTQDLNQLVTKVEAYIQANKSAVNVLGPWLQEIKKIAAYQKVLAAISETDIHFPRLISEIRNSKARILKEEWETTCRVLETASCRKNGNVIAELTSTANALEKANQSEGLENSLNSVNIAVDDVRAIKKRFVPLTVNSLEEKSELSIPSKPVIVPFLVNILTQKLQDLGITASPATFTSNAANELEDYLAQQSLSDQLYIRKFLDGFLLPTQISNQTTEGTKTKLEETAKTALKQYFSLSKDVGNARQQFIDSLSTFLFVENKNLLSEALNNNLFFENLFQNEDQAVDQIYRTIINADKAFKNSLPRRKDGQASEIEKYLKISIQRYLNSMNGISPINVEEQNRIKIIVSVTYKTLLKKGEKTSKDFVNSFDLSREQIPNSSVLQTLLLEQILDFGSSEFLGLEPKDKITMLYAKASALLTQFKKETSFKGNGGPRKALEKRLPSQSINGQLFKTDDWVEETAKTTLQAALAIDLPEFKPTLAAETKIVLVTTLMDVQSDPHSTLPVSGHIKPPPIEKIPQNEKVDELYNLLFCKPEAGRFSSLWGQKDEKATSELFLGQFGLELADIPEDTAKTIISQSIQAVELNYELLISKVKGLATKHNSKEKNSYTNSPESVLAKKEYVEYVQSKFYSASEEKQWGDVNKGGLEKDITQINEQIKSKIDPSIIKISKIKPEHEGKLKVRLPNGEERLIEKGIHEQIGWLLKPSQPTAVSAAVLDVLLSSEEKPLPEIRADLERHVKAVLSEEYKTVPDFTERLWSSLVWGQEDIKKLIATVASTRFVEKLQQDLAQPGVNWPPEVFTVLRDIVQATIKTTIQNQTYNDFGLIGIEQAIQDLAKNAVVFEALNQALSQNKIAAALQTKKTSLTLDSSPLDVQTLLPGAEFVFSVLQKIVKYDLIEPSDKEDKSDQPQQELGTLGTKKLEKMLTAYFADEPEFAPEPVQPAQGGANSHSKSTSFFGLFKRSNTSAPSKPIVSKPIITRDANATEPSLSLEKQIEKALNASAKYSIREKLTEQGKPDQLTALQNKITSLNPQIADLQRQVDNLEPRRPSLSFNS